MAVDKEKFIDDIDNIGFTVHQSAFDPNVIKELDEYAKTMRPMRGHALDRSWHGWDACASMQDPQQEVDWAYYWTDDVSDHAIVQEHITPVLGECADAAFGKDNWSWHVIDFIVLHPGMDFMRPHIDTPYRFKEFKYSEELLGLQFMVMMCDFNEVNGATGYVPGTHKYLIDADEIFQQKSWEAFFSDNCKQYTASQGSFVCWHPRVLHSTMPNYTNQVRRALLLHASPHSVRRKLLRLDPTVNQTLRTS